jgi:phasin family protein
MQHIHLHDRHNTADLSAESSGKGSGMKQDESTRKQQSIDEKGLEAMTTEKSKTKGNGSAAGWDATKSFGDLASAGRENFDAFLKASTIVTAGYGAIGQAWLEYSRQALEQNAESAKEMLAAKSAQDIVELQSDWAKGAFEGYVAETTKLSEMAVKTVNEAVAPIQSRVDELVTTFTKHGA